MHFNASKEISTLKCRFLHFTSAFKTNPSLCSRRTLGNCRGPELEKKIHVEWHPCIGWKNQLAAKRISAWCKGAEIVKSEPEDAHSNHGLNSDIKFIGITLIDCKYSQLSHLFTAVARREFFFKHFEFYKYFCLILGLLKSRISKQSFKPLGRKPDLNFFHCNARVQPLSKITSIATRNRF